MTARAAVVALVVVLAGCQLVGAGGESTPTATPAPVPTLTPEPTPATDRVDLPPGVARNGVSQVAVLALAHYDSAAGTRYVWTERQESEASDSASAITAVTREITLVDGTRYAMAFSTRRVPAGSFDAAQPVTRFADGQRRYSRYGSTDGSPPSYSTVTATNASRMLAMWATAAVQLYLDLPNATISAVSVDGERHYRITAHRDTYASTSGYRSESLRARNYTARALVSPDGFVQQLRVVYTATGDGFGAPVDHEAGDRVTYRFAYSQVGSASVQPPDWVDRARASAERRAQSRSGNATAPASEFDTPPGGTLFLSTEPRP